MKKKTQATKAELRQQLEVAQAAVENAKTERDAARTQIAMIDRHMESMRHERAHESRMVRRIIDLINANQPSSALLPDHLRFKRADSFDAKHTRMAPPAFASMDFTFDRKRLIESVEPLQPIILNDLYIFLQDNPSTWSRLVTIEYKPSRSGLTDARMQLKLSEETLCALGESRERFCEEIGRQVAVALYRHLIERKS